MLVGTHQDDELCKAENYQQNLLTSIASKYAPKYPNICSLRLVGADGENAETVQSELERVLSEHLQSTMLERRLPKKFFELDRIIKQEGRLRNSPLITKDEYTSLARLCLIQETEELQNATSFLRIQGSLCVFTDKEQVSLRLLSSLSIPLCRSLLSSLLSHLSPPFPLRSLPLPLFLSRLFPSCPPQQKQLQDTVVLSPLWLWDIVAALQQNGADLKNGILYGANLTHVWEQSRFGSFHRCFIMPLLEMIEAAFELRVQDKLQGCLNNKCEPLELPETKAASARQLAGGNDLPMVSFEPSSILPKYQDPEASVAMPTVQRKRRAGTVGVPFPHATLRLRKASPVPQEVNTSQPTDQPSKIWFIPSLLPALPPVGLGVFWETKG